jgi:hypothetical protein
VAANVIRLVERRPAIRSTWTARVAANLDRERHELWAAFMAIQARAGETSGAVTRRDHEEAVGELLDALDAVYAAEVLAREVARQVAFEARSKDADALLVSAMHLAHATKRHRIAIARDALLDGLALLWLRSRISGPAWNLEASLPMLLGSLDLEARAERLRRQLRLGGPTDAA